MWRPRRTVLRRHRHAGQRRSTGRRLGGRLGRGVPCAPLLERRVHRQRGTLADLLVTAIEHGAQASAHRLRIAQVDGRDLPAQRLEMLQCGVRDVTVGLALELAGVCGGTCDHPLVGR